LKKEILTGIQVLRFNKPRSIQAKTIPIIIDTDKNIIAQSQSGTGKTLCFAIGMLNVVDPEKKHPQALLLSPALELAEQSFLVIKK